MAHSFCRFLAVSFLLSVVHLCAQSLAQMRAGEINLGQSAVPLNGPWKFTIGDSPLDPNTGKPLWANPGFDDSRWETVDLKPQTGSADPITGTSGFVPGWTSKGHPGYWGYAWYRIHVRVHATSGGSLALEGPADVDDAYQSFANGALLGSFGKFPGGGKTPVSYNTQPIMFQLAQEDAARPDDLVLAFRFWMNPSTLIQAPDAGGMHNAPLLGEYGTVVARYQLAWMALIRSYSSAAVLAALYLLLFFMACSLMLFDRSDAVYRWLAAEFVLIASERANLCVLAWWPQFESLSIATWLQDFFLSSLILGVWAMVWWSWFRLRRPLWIPKVIGALTLLFSFSRVFSESAFSGIPQGVAAASDAVFSLTRLLFILIFVFLAVQGVRKQGREGWLALPGLVLVGISQFQTELVRLHIPAVWFPFGAQLSLASVANLLLVAVIFVLLIRRLLISVRQQRELALDVKQAQEVQQVILPEPLVTVAGLAIESEYRPALEVGGDFFQIIPHPTGHSVLIVAGDVTGKGLKAGMLVALLVGAIRMAAESNPEPASLLRALNRRLIGRGDAHATCLVLRIDEDGAATLANAGHLPPYLNETPVEIEGSLPLGIVEELECSVRRFRMADNDRLLMLSDGVVEATNAAGELLGFDQVMDMVRAASSIGKIADAARAFGQTDDITVIAVTRMPVAEPAMA